MVHSVYNSMWKKFKKASQTNGYELDPYLLNPNSDTRRGMSVLAYLDQANAETLSEILSFQHTIREIEPHQYYHPINELHLTILPIISCLPSFQLSHINQVDYINIFQSVIKKAPPIEIKFQGITASTNCIVIQGFPLDDKLEKLRNALRSALQKANVRANFDTRYKLVTAHSSAIRFCVPITDAKCLYQTCNQYRSHLFGKVTLNNFSLVFNNWYQNLSITQLLSQTSTKFSAS